MQILDGRKVKEEIKNKLIKKLEIFSVKPELGIIQVGDNPASNAYVKQKILFGQEIGVKVNLYKFPEDIAEEKIIEKVNEVNDDEKIKGVILQLPVPKNLNVNKILNCIKPEKDVDGLSAINIHKLVSNDSTGIIPATAKGIISLLDYYQIPIAGKNIVVVGRSLLVGKSLALALINRDATVTVCHSETADLDKHLYQAEIIISAVGKPGILNNKNLKPEHIVVDVGITREEEDLLGDVSSENLNVKALSPVPGGVGQMTVVSLFTNLVDASS